MNITARVTLAALALLVVCSVSLADVIPVTSAVRPAWKPQEPRQEFVVTVYAFSAEQTATVDADAFGFNNPRHPDTFTINSDPKQFIKQMQAQYPGFGFSIISSGSKVCSNQEPCTFTVSPKPDDPTLTTMTAEFKLNVRPSGEVALHLRIGMTCVDPDNPMVSDDGKTVVPNEKSQDLYTQRMLKPGEVTVVGGFKGEQDGVRGFAISLAPHTPQPE